MGNKQSVTITQEKTDHDAMQGKKDEANGHMKSGLDLTDSVTCEASVQQNTEPPLPVKVTVNAKSTPTSVEVNGIKAKAPTVSVEATDNQVSATTESTEQKTSTESSTSAKDAPKQPNSPSLFNKMFKKKTEALITAEEETKSQKSNLSVEANGPQAEAAVSVEASGIQVSGTTESTEQKTTAESSTPAKDSPKQQNSPSLFNKMFKKKTEALITAEVETESQKSNLPVSVEANGPQAKAAVSVEASGNQVSGTTESTEQKTTAESSTPAKDSPKQPNSMFNKMFKKKTEALITAEVETESQKSNLPVSVEANGPQAKAAVSVEASGIQVSGTTESTEQKTTAESSTPAKDSPKQQNSPSLFNKMFKKKTEALITAEVETESQKSNSSVSVEANGLQAKAVSGTTESTEQKTTAESSTPAKDSPKQPTTTSKFNKMFKKKTEALITAEVETESQKSNSSVSVEANGLQAKAVSGTTESTEQKTTAESSTPAKDAPKQPTTPSKFNKMFKKKTGPVPPASEENVAAEALIVAAVETDSHKSEPTDIKASTQAEKVPEGEVPKPSTTEVTQDTTQPEQSSIEEKSVMNFFKTFVTSTKTTKEATASPDVSKEQSKKETPPAPAANVQEASKVPPPPPPAPPKMESKAEPAVKKDEAPPVEVAATAAKEQETQGKTKTKDSPFSKLFRTKALLGKKGSKGASVPAKTSSASVVMEEAKPVEIQVDASKTSTLEAGAKAEPPPAPRPEEKKADKKPSPFANLLKPKVLLGQVSSKIHAAASSAAAGISLSAGGAATEPKKEAPATTTAPAEAVQSTKAKEEPKPAAPAAPVAASQDSKPVGSTDNSSPSTARKLEKRNSIQLFFKNLGQKRHSDAGVQTEPAAPEKAK